MDAKDLIIRRMTKDELVLALDWAADEVGILASPRPLFAPLSSALIQLTHCFPEITRMPVCPYTPPFPYVYFTTMGERGGQTYPQPEDRE